jgi:hypothetical protein
MVGRAILRGMVAVGLLGALSGCAGALGSSPSKKLEQAHAGTHVYHRPAPEVAAAVRAELEAEGFTLDPVSDDRLVSTQWSWPLEDEQFVSQGERYVVVVRRLTAHFSRVEAVKFTMWTGGVETYHPLKPLRNDKGTNANTVSYGKGLSPLLMGTPTYARDFQFEWALLRRVDPLDARRIEDTVHAELARR